MLGCIRRYCCVEDDVGIAIVGLEFFADVCGNREIRTRKELTSEYGLKEVRGRL